jgi:hypothetical protein
LRSHEEEEEKKVFHKWLPNFFSRLFPYGAMGIQLDDLFAMRGYTGNEETMPCILKLGTGRM